MGTLYVTLAVLWESIRYRYISVALRPLKVKVRAVFLLPFYSKSSDSSPSRLTLSLPRLS